jgi:WhiB family redox-sensing transcriptional regulator
MDWRFTAACWSCDPELFFPLSPHGVVAERQVTQAKAICARCPVRAKCLDFALSTRQAYGVWGGLSEQELHLLRRNDGRPADMAAGKSRRDRVQADEFSGTECLARESSGGLPAVG